MLVLFNDRQQEYYDVKRNKWEHKFKTYKRDL